MDVITKFISKSTVLIRAYAYDEDGALTDPTNTDNPITVVVNDSNGVQKVGYISVADNSGFAIGDTVTGGTSEATGFVISKVGTTILELQRVTGVWQSGETIEDTGSGSTTTSALLGAAMTKHGAEAGVYDYFYNTIADSAEGSWPGEVTTLDGTGVEIRTSIQSFSFTVKKGL